jgi:hypothetical protein
MTYKYGVGWGIAAVVVAVFVQYFTGYRPWRQGPAQPLQ